MYLSRYCWSANRCAVAVLILAAGATTGCENARKSFGLARSAPDEFAVVTRAPLKVPPDYRLRPPAPGAPRPQEKTVTASARASLVGLAQGGSNSPVASGGVSAGEAALLSKAGASRTDPSIRAKVNRESAVLAQSGDGLFSRILFWQEKEIPGVIVDPAKERKRIQENIALGDNVTKGPVPIIKRREKGWLEGIF